ncbi:MAG: exodeoxyribonuclease VII large subunit [Firmicutes bacterium]|nr:exodeoxyribonuclease VII large subunit [Bacillota bacterium]
MSGPANRRILTVSQVNRYIKMVLEEDVFLGDIFIRGEISNFKRHGSGHWYFSLKDEAAAIQCVMFRQHVPEYAPKDGMSVIVGGHVSLYEKTGLYQLYAEVMEPLGKGSLALAFEQTKEKLEREGLFDAARKRPIPRNPGTVAVITSPTGAALRDIITVARGRNPSVELVLIPALVQGSSAAGEIAAALGMANEWGKADVIILGRGGGSAEDLWPFNEETVARAIRRSGIPVISAVGHETDVTIADFAADLRAPTPSAAAAAAVPALEGLRGDVAGLYGMLNRSLERKLASAKEGLRGDVAGLYGMLNRSLERKLASAKEGLRGDVAGLYGMLNRSLERKLASSRERLARAAGRPVLKRPLEPVRNAEAYVAALNGRMAAAMNGRLERGRGALGNRASALEHLSPMRTLERGFAAVEGPDGTVISSAGGVAAGMDVTIRFRDGSAGARITEAVL